MWLALGKHFASQGHEVVHISRLFANLPAEEWIEGVLHRRVRGYPAPTSGLKTKILDLLYARRAVARVPMDSDVVITNTFWAPLLLPAQLRRRCIPDVARLPKGQMLLYHQAARLRANSTAVAEAIRRELPARDHARVLTIPNPLPFEAVVGAPLASKKAVMLYAGRIHPEKGLDLLIRAFRLLNTEWQLMLVGPWQPAAGGGGERYLRKLEALAGKARIEFAGPIWDENQLNQRYADAAVFVYPSIAEQGETFGLAPLEAMAWGCVPVVSDLACFKDFIHHEKNGLVFNHRTVDADQHLCAALQRLLVPELRLSLARQALGVRRSHATSAIASEFLDAFSELQTQPA
jgi:glycosyltransferase involved in cell wall biosynthesis